MLGRASLIAVSIALLSGAGVVAQREIGAQAVAGLSDMSFFNAMAVGDGSLPLSYRLTDALTQRCVNVVGGLYGTLQPDDTALEAKGNCLTLARQAVADMPTYALGWYASALLAYQLERNEEADAALVMSQQVGRHEQWVAEARVQLAEDHLSSLSQQALDGHAEDLQLLARSARGVRSIAYRYVTQPNFRERITLIVEQLSPEDQIRFIGNVRNAAQIYGMVVQ